MDSKLVGQHHSLSTPRIIHHHRHQQQQQYQRNRKQMLHNNLVVRGVVTKQAESNNSVDIETTTSTTTTTNCSKNKYEDSWFDRLAIDHLSHSVQVVSGLRSKKSGYDGLVETTRAVFRKFDSTQQQLLVLKALHRAIPRPFLFMISMMLPQSRFAREYCAAFTTLFFSWLVGPCQVKEAEFNGRREKNVVHIEKCRFLEETSCVGMCTNLCKMPSQTFIKSSLGMPVNMVPNFDDMSCEMIFGEDPPPTSQDPAMMQPCYKLCNSKKQHNNCVSI